MLRRGIPNISYYLVDDICGFLVNKRTKLLLGDLNLAKMVPQQALSSIPRRMKVVMEAYEGLTKY